MSKLSTVEDDKPLKRIVEFPPPVHRNLVAYAEAIGRESGQPVPDSAKVVPLMVERFMATERACRTRATS
jgi:hypothetical protein